jgi:hypothetical protein
MIFLYVDIIIFQRVDDLILIGFQLTLIQYDFLTPMLIEQIERRIFIVLQIEHRIVWREIRGLVEELLLLLALSQLD